MKPFILFAYDTYYPSGGWTEVAGLFENLDSAIFAAETMTEGWKEIVDLRIGSIVWENDKENKYR
jgi:hypothetical protein